MHPEAYLAALLRTAGLSDNDRLLLLAVLTLGLVDAVSRGLLSTADVAVLFANATDSDQDARVRKMLEKGAALLELPGSESVTAREALGPLHQDALDALRYLAQQRRGLSEGAAKPETVSVIRDRAPPQAATVPPGSPMPDPDRTATLAPTASLTQVDDSATELPTIPGYAILSELGRGGMGVVYKARHLALRRTVALKMIRAGTHGGPTELARFRTEGEAAARMQHPNIVQIYEVGEHHGLPYISLEYVRGGSLAEQLDGEPWGNHEAAGLLAVLADAIQHAHDRDIIHRDLKPANILLAELSSETDTELIPKITDFGLAKRLEEGTGLTQTGAVMGTARYMAPEQAAAKNEEIGPAADVYALGAILYELLTGRPPFTAAASLDVVLQVLGDEPVSPRQRNAKVPRDLETICLKCLRKKPHDRYVNAAALAADLRRFMEGEPITARPLGEFRLATRWAKEYPLTAVATILALIWVFATLMLSNAMILFGTSGAFAGSRPAGQTAFVATIAILVRPRRWVVLFGLLCVLGVLVDHGILLGFFMNRSAAWDIGLQLLIELGGGVLAAGILGGISRWLARLYDADMLSIFFSGMCAGLIAGAIGFCGCISTDFTRESMLVILVFRGVAIFVVGFGLGSWLAARHITRLRPRLR
jgi:hypothetical protein